MNNRANLFALLLLMLLTFSTMNARGDSTDAVLDALHEAGAASDALAFTTQLTTDAVVLGMNGAGPLAGTALRSHIEVRFNAGDAWTYRSVNRDIRYSPDGNTAWFSESLESSEGSPGWGSGVLVRTAEGWKVAQYSSAPVVIAGAAPSPTSPGSDPVQSVETESAAQESGTETAVVEPAKKKNCRRMRHKTNKVSSC